ncbi:MAG: dihydrolipoamide acetyltransferase family protein [Terriglobia bacterium]
MPADVLMPQMGESVVEGTVTRWLKKVGDPVGKDEPLFEISTEKVDAEIPSPVAGILKKILVSEGQTVAVRALVAQIETDAAAGPGSAPPEKAAAVSPPAAEPAQSSRTEVPGKTDRPVIEEAGGTAEAEEEQHVRTSPLVRRLAKEHGVDLLRVEGTGSGGRITKEDLLAHVERQKAPAAPASVTPARREAPPAAGPREEVVPMTPIRKKIAEHMVMSRRTSAHVTTVFQMDLTRVVDIYHREKERFEKKENTRLTYTPFFVRAAVAGLRRFPILNSSVSGDNIVYKKDIHMGIAVALDWGLIVPVIHHADEKSFLGLARAVNDLAERARTKKLLVDEVQGGTFTITNFGLFGSLFAMPIISQPQVGILGVGSIHKAPVVINDAIAIRSIAHLSLSYDHRVVDGAVADQFMAVVKQYLESWDEELLA